MDNERCLIRLQNKIQNRRHLACLDLEMLIKLYLIALLTICSQANLNQTGYLHHNKSIPVKSLSNQVNSTIISKLDYTDSSIKIASPSPKARVVTDEGNDTKLVQNYKKLLKIPQTLDLVVGNNSASIRLNELERHSYNVSQFPTIHKGSNQSSPELSQTKYPTGNATSIDYLETSDSNYVPQSSSDDGGEFGESSSTNDLDVQEELDQASEMASSNRNQQKVAKELTKILSKGISGATDQVRLETLESWKKRQKERKATKETRAKVFEEILNAAISSHPEKIKAAKQNKKTREESIRTFHSPPPSASNEYESAESPDPELVSDAETVVKQLQGIATLVDSQTNGVTSADQQSNNENDSSNGSVDENQSASSSSQTGSDVEFSLKKVMSQNYRPFSKKIKKFKQQISNRRKQLDNIKKMFNVDLAINPKDGSLVDKSATKRIKEKSRGAYDESSENEHIGSFSSTRAKSSKAKMQDLMSYLKENPELLASVMAELTIDSDPRSSQQSSSNIEDNYNQPSSSSVPLDHSDSSMPNAHMDNTRKYHYSQKAAFMSNESEDAAPWNLKPPNSRVSNTNKPHASIDMSEIPDDIPDTQFSKSVRRSKYRRNPRGFTDSNDQVSSLSSTSRPSPAEKRLLESLRDRQLLNLARLDQVLTDRHHMSGSSQVFKTTNSSTTTSSDVNSRSDRKRSNHQDRSLPSGGQSQQSNQSESVFRGTPLGRVTGSSGNPQSDEEVLHHFMVVNQELGDRVAANDSFMTKMSNQPPSPLGPSISFMAPPGFQQAHSYNNFQTPPLQHSQPQLVAPMNTIFGKYQGAAVQSLDRFKDWKDTSQSEASGSSFYGYKNRANDSIRASDQFLPRINDLKTGSSATQGSLGPVLLPNLLQSTPTSTNRTPQQLQHGRQLIQTTQQQYNQQSHHQSQQYQPYQQQQVQTDQQHNRLQSLPKARPPFPSSDTAVLLPKPDVYSDNRQQSFDETQTDFHRADRRRSDVSISRAGPSLAATQPFQNSHLVNTVNGQAPAPLFMPSSSPFMTRSSISGQSATTIIPSSLQSWPIVGSNHQTKNTDPAPIRDVGDGVVGGGESQFKRNTQERQPEKPKDTNHYSGPVDYFKAYKSDWPESRVDNARDEDDTSVSGEEGPEVGEPPDPDTGAMWA